MFGFARLTVRVSLLLVFAACGGLPAPQSSTIDTADITVAVDNRNFNDATIYARAGDNRTRVGRVTGKTTQEFTFKWYQQQIRMEIDFTGGRRLFSGTQIVVPGEIDDFLLVIGVSPSGPVTLTGR